MPYSFGERLFLSHSRSLGSVYAAPPVGDFTRPFASNPWMPNPCAETTDGLRALDFKGTTGWDPDPLVEPCAGEY